MSLHFNALHSLSSPYIEWFLDKLGHDRLNKLLVRYDHTTTCARYVFTFCAGPSYQAVTLIICSSKCNVPARLSNTFRWNLTFQPDNEQGQPNDKTFVEMNKIIKRQISHRSRVFKLVKSFFDKHSNYRS
ncbi:unnamed protein product [Rotaria sp. Silwood2]|nr:unnamed protein product [Rotaria sp. Silwood2]CAF2949838.1 unnamed protein product [Rotaria sp. Silwood2]CAF3038850.1 unnamed protein product [Rotaria sp. Silwood2]CAF3296303.1 unnamed protein product [Rotaria sp. Silwood2]CAF3930933.1 unnamed protein product [Rotaria sp. Silwood2]